MSFKKLFRAAAALAATVLLISAAHAYEAVGVVPGTSIEYSGLSVTKGGVNIVLTNTDESAVKVSMRLNFYDKNGNTVGYTIFGLREIDGKGSSAVTGNYLNGKWKPCKDAYRIGWQRMTFELLYR